ncbi:MAG: SH3 domain-containing protein [Caldilineaceae bacterium]|nr:SH3 domain-containing protein [Caldilineaceae bacterium]MCB0140303.1 SH3 domain-containing protein [Caldilineaceae bacterium]
MKLNRRSWQLFWLFTSCIGVILANFLCVSAAFSQQATWNIPASGSSAQQGRRWVRMGGRGGGSASNLLDICPSIYSNNQDAHIWFVTPMATREVTGNMATVNLIDFYVIEEIEPQIVVKLCKGDFKPLTEIYLTGPSGFYANLQPEISVEMSYPTLSKRSVLQYTHKFSRSAEEDLYELTINEPSETFTYTVSVVKGWEGIQFDLLDPVTKELRHLFRPDEEIHVLFQDRNEEQQIQLELFKSVLDDSDTIEVGYQSIAQDVYEISAEGPFDLNLTGLTPGSYMLVARRQPVSTVLDDQGTEANDVIEPVGNNYVLDSTARDYYYRQNFIVAEYEELLSLEDLSSYLVTIPAKEKSKVIWFEVDANQRIQAEAYLQTSSDPVSASLDIIDPRLDFLQPNSLGLSAARIASGTGRTFFKAPESRIYGLELLGAESDEQVTYNVRISPAPSPNIIAFDIPMRSEYEEPVQYIFDGRAGQQIRISLELMQLIATPDLLPVKLFGELGDELTLSNISGAPDWIEAEVLLPSSQQYFLQVGPFQKDPLFDIQFAGAEYELNLSITSSLIQWDSSNTPHICNEAAVSDRVYWLYIREQPSPNSPDVGAVAKNNTVNIFCDFNGVIESTDEEGRIWTRVQRGDIVGWMSKEYLQYFDK